MSGFLTETLTRTTRLGGKILFQILSLCGCMSVMPGRKWKDDAPNPSACLQKFDSISIQWKHTTAHIRDESVWMNECLISVRLFSWNEKNPSLSCIMNVEMHGDLSTCPPTVQKWGCLITNTANFHQECLTNGATVSRPFPTAHWTGKKTGRSPNVHYKLWLFSDFTAPGLCEG